MQQLQRMCGCVVSYWHRGDGEPTKKLDIAACLPLSLKVCVVLLDVFPEDFIASVAGPLGRAGTGANGKSRLVVADGSGCTPSGARRTTAAGGGSAPAGIPVVGIDLASKKCIVDGVAAAVKLLTGGTVSGRLVVIDSLSTYLAMHPSSSSYACR
jgi:hypothetical protein